METKANLVEDYDKLKNPGDFMYFTSQGSNAETGLMFMCPCGCGDHGAVSFTSQFADPKHPKWTWDGNREQPTLSPSIQRLSGCRWHGFLQAGVFRSV